MIPKECKRLAEVDFPIAEVSKHSAREKSIRHGHPSTLHLWWARRPLAACRAMLMALLLPDPGDKYCPEEFKQKARQTLLGMHGRPMKWDKLLEKDEGLRKVILNFIADFANWDNSSNSDYLKTARALVKAAHPEDVPLVVDPFSGGGSIPLEALRLGCDAFASDLNPVACLILKVMLEDIPRYGQGLAQQLKVAGIRVKERALKELEEYYPIDANGNTPIAYFWARTVRCESPACGAEIPLMRTNLLAKRQNKNRNKFSKLVSLHLKVDPKSKMVTPEIKSLAEQKNSVMEDEFYTVKGGKAICPSCGKVLSDKQVRAQLTAQRGGSDTYISQGERRGGAMLLAVALRDNKTGGITYRSPLKLDYVAIEKAHIYLQKLIKSRGVAPLPSEPINPVRPSPNARGVSGATRIGITDFGRLFTQRQKLSLHKLSTVVTESVNENVIKRLLLLAVSKQSERCTSFVTWINTTEAPRGTFARQALTIAWDFVELVPLTINEEFIELIDAMAEVIKAITNAAILPAHVEQCDATKSVLPDSSVPIWMTDPPYYDAVPYADLSDVFYIWLKRVIPINQLNVIFKDTDIGLTPKEQECTWNRAHLVNGKQKSPETYENTLAIAFNTTAAL